MVGGLGWRPPPTDTTSVERGTVPRSSPRVVGRPHLIPLDSPLIGLRTRKPKNHCNNRKSCQSTSNFRSSCHHLSYFCPTPPSSSSSEGVIHEQHLKINYLKDGSQKPERIREALKISWYFLGIFPKNGSGWYS